MLTQMKCALALFCLMACPCAWSCIGSLEPPLDQLLRDSDLVAKARVLSVTTGERASPFEEPPRFAEVAIERIYKGDPAIQTAKLHWRNLVMCHGVTLQPSSYVVLFLNRDGDGFTFKDLQWGKLPSDPLHGDLPNGSTDAATLLDSDIRAELRDDTGEELLAAVRLFAALHRRTQQQAQSCPSGSRCLPKMLYTHYLNDRELRALLPTSDPLLEATVHWALLHIGDERLLAQAATIAEAANAQREFRLPDDAVPRQRAEIAGELENIVDDSEVPLLNRLSGSRSELVRRAVTYALRQNHSPSSVPYLMSRLDDEDIETVVQATWALFEIVSPTQASEGWIAISRLPRRAEDDQKTLEAVTRWKNWWSSPASEQFKSTQPTVR